jgi:ATP-binding protein involved in chromosome partitioning
MSDPRIAVIGRRLENIGKIIAVSSGKGGVGKSVVASALALNLRDAGYRVGLFDLDFTSPATHVILGVSGLYPEEEYGIIPPNAHGLKYMSITYYSLDKPTPLRGIDVSEAIIELFAITRWGELDYLIIDMPPGLGDATLDMIRLIEGINFIVVTTPSRVAFETVKKQLSLLKDLHVSVIGVVENMVMKPSDYVKQQLSSDGFTHLVEIAYDPTLENCLGDVDCLLSTTFSRSVKGLLGSVE